MNIHRINTVRPALLATCVLLIVVAAVVIARAVAFNGAPAAQEIAAQDHSAHAGMDMDQNAGTDMLTSEDGSVHIDPAVAQALGVTVATAELAVIDGVVRATGNVVYDETMLTTITPKFSGFVERLHVNFTGQPVRRGQPLLEIYAPELVAGQEELLAALRMQAQLTNAARPVADRAATLVDAARRRLMLWDISAAQLQEIERTLTVRRTLTLHAPSGGFVTELMVQSGQAVTAGMPLYRLADLASVWIEADVYEQDLRMITIGGTAQVEVAAWPGETFTGRVTYIHPEVRAETRTTRVRVQLANRDGRIRPGMYATVELATRGAASAVVVPRDAVMHGATHAMVFVEEAPGSYRARQVTVGRDADGLTQILSGLSAGERVVSRANFLLDSESRLSGVMGAMPGMDH